MRVTILKKNSKTLLTAYLLVVPAVALVMLIVAYPIFSSIVLSFTDKSGKFTLSNYAYFFMNKQELSNILFTLYIAIITVVLSIVIAYAIALYLRFVKTPVSRLIGGLYLIPRFVPSVVAVYAMMIIVKDSGLLNRISKLFGGNFKPGLMYNPNGMIIMNLWFNIPFAALIIVSSLGSIPDSIVESARDVGAKKMKTFVTMILPLSYKDVLTAATFVFLGNVGSFTTPYLMMGSTTPKMLGIDLFQQFNSYMDYQKTAALSVIMFLICSISAGVYIYTNLKKDRKDE